MKTIELDYGEKLPKNYTGIIEYKDGDTGYYLNGSLHREDGPAVLKKDGTLEYWLNGNLHREDGPAKIYPDGIIKYYINNINITVEVNNWLNGKTDIPP